MMHKTCSINYRHLADLQKTLPTTDLNNNKKTFHLIKYLLATFIFSFLFNLYLFINDFTESYEIGFSVLVFDKQDLTGGPHNIQPS